MKTIISEAKIFTVVFGKQQVQKNNKYRLLNYCVSVKHNGEILLYNNLTKEIIVFENDEADILNATLFIPDNELITTLIEKWFLVPINHDDKKLCNQVTALARQFASNSPITAYDILPTTGCNARCFYCFEAGVTAKNMSPETAHATAEYIIQKSNKKKVSINWFGGEPLCNTRAIDIICNELVDKKIEYTSTITTNGYLFTEETIKKAKELWRLRNAQITLDGMQETYNKVKAYVNNDPNPFGRVITNIGRLLENGITVKIRLNMDFYNEAELYKLVDYLYKLFGNKKGLSIYAHELFENEGHVKTTRSVEEREEIIERFLKLRSYIHDLGLGSKSVLKNEIKINYCMADCMYATMISPEGKLGCCEHFVDDDFYGSVFEMSARKTWNEYDEYFPQCENCIMYPSCIRLKKCPNYTRDCSNDLQFEKIDDLKKSIIYTYEQSKADAKKK